MVRHEAAEALGAIASPECLDILQRFVIGNVMLLIVRSYKDDPEQVVRESCLVALDMYEFEHSDDFNYADGLQTLKQQS